MIYCLQSKSLCTSSQCNRPKASACSSKSPTATICTSPKSLQRPILRQNPRRTPNSSKGEKRDEFFGKQTVYHHTAQVDLPYKQAAPQYKLTLTYQGCAEAGVCYPPVDTEFDVKGSGVYRPQSDEPVSAKDRFYNRPPLQTAKCQRNPVQTIPTAAASSSLGIL